jgi:hypothetical protein
MFDKNLYNEMEYYFNEFIKKEDPPYLVRERVRMRMEPIFGEEKVNWFFSLYEELPPAKVLDDVGVALLACAIKRPQLYKSLIQALNMPPEISKERTERILARADKKWGSLF